MQYLSTAFSPMMLGEGVKATVIECSIEGARRATPVATSIVGHEITALVLSTLLGSKVAFNRSNVCLKAGDSMYVVIPNFRANEAREFTQTEVEAAGFRCFYIYVQNDFH